MVESVDVTEDFDEVIGICSGGAFVADYIGHKLGVNHSIKIESTHWSRIGVFKLLHQLIFYGVCLFNNVQFEKLNIKKMHIKGTTENLLNKKILLVDDSVSSSRTMISAKQLLLDAGAKEVITFSLFVSSETSGSSKFMPDYYYTKGAIPIIWPWGFEAD